jgi:hypothetical protein
MKREYTLTATCEHCKERSITGKNEKQIIKDMLKHEAHCRFNPKNKNCLSCKNIGILQWMNQKYVSNKSCYEKRKKVDKYLSEYTFCPKLVEILKGQ